MINKTEQYFIVNIVSETIPEGGHDEFGNKTDSNTKYIAYAMCIDPDQDVDDQFRGSSIKGGRVKESPGEAFESSLAHMMVTDKLNAI